MVALNRGLVSDPAVLFVCKESGLGREGAHHDFFDCLESKDIAAA